MYNLAQLGYTNQQVLDMLETDRQIDFDFDVINKQDVKVGSLSQAECEIMFDSSTEVMGTVSCNYKQEDWLDGLVEWRLRPVMKLKSPNGWLKFPLGVYIMSTPTLSGDDAERYGQATGYDYSLILKEDKVIGRHYISAGSSYTSKVGELLASSGIQKINITPSSLTLPVALEWEIGTPVLTIVNDLLSAINYEPLHFDLNGYAVSKAYVEPVNRGTDYFYMTDDESLVKEGSAVSRDTFNKANVFVRYTDSPEVGELTATVVNDSVESPLSTVSRGRRIVDVETVEDIADQATLTAYTRRIAIERSQVYESVNLQTAIMPHHGYRDCLYIRHNTLGIGTRYIEYAWSLPLRVGGTMSHTLKRVVQL